MNSKYAQSRSASIASSSPSSIKDFAKPKVNMNTPYYHHFKQFAKEVEQAENDDDESSQEHLEALKRLMEKRRNNGNSRSYSLNDSNIVPYSSRKYSAQIMPVNGIKEDDENAES